MPDADYDVAIIGGGPAGSTAATFLARAGRRVVVFEREKFPRFHIGESLLPISMKTFTRLGVHEKFERAGFMRKYGGEMASACSDEGVKFYFKDGYRSQTETSYQVPRAEFDRVLLDHAAESGAEVRQQTTVKGIEFLADHADALLRLEADPERFPPYYRGFRRVLTHRFPYKIFFRIAGQNIIVVRILHGAQDHTRKF